MKSAQACLSFVVWLVCGAAWASGSTRVEETGEHHRVILETPRKIFARGKGEGRYHREARERLTGEMSVLKPIVEKAFAKLRDEAPGRFKLRKFERTLEHCRDSADEASPATQASPCRLTIPLPPEARVSEFGSVEVALDSAPSAKDRAELTARIQKAIGAGYALPDDAGPPR
jgi:hypothetical protein